MDIIKRVGILCGYRFPEGMAPTSRILAYSKGLVENGVDVDVIIFRPTDRGESLGARSGEINGIKYKYPYNRVWSSSSFGRWFWDRPISYILTLSAIIKMNKQKKIDFIFLSFDAIQNLFLFITFLRIIGIKQVFIGDEYPIPIRHFLKDKIPFYKTILYRFIFKYLTAMVLMTENLGAYFNNIRLKPTHILSSITDISRFENLTLANTSSKKKYLCYMGNMELAKDNIDIIIEAFRQICNKYQDIDLYLYGTPSQKDFKILKDLINKYSLNDRIFFKGRINYNEVPLVLKKAYILVSSQPDTLRAAGGFPTKLGEYMATGIPILTTDVGEISNYVSHGKQLWLAKPNNPNDFAIKLEFIINNYCLALKVAIAAIHHVESNFSPKYVSSKLKCFLGKNLR